MTHQYTNTHQGIFLEFSQYPNLVGLLPSKMYRSQSLSENFRAPLSPNALSNFWRCRIPMNCSVSFSLFLVIMAHQSHANFEVAVERDSRLKDGQARILFHFLSFVSVVSFVQHTGSEGTWESFARVSPMLDFLSKLFVPKVIPNWRFLVISESRMFGLDYSELYDVNFDDWSN